MNRENREFIDGLFAAGYKDTEVVEASKEIHQLQHSERTPLKTGVDHMDFFLFDGLTNKMVFIGSRPAMGKTHNCARIIANLIDEQLNPMDVSVLRLNWEMQTKSLLLRALKSHLKKPMREIISVPFTEEEKPKVYEAVNEIRNPRVRNVSSILEGEDLEYMLDSFGKSGTPEQEKVVIVDHLHILTSKERIDNFLSICNKYKLKYPRLSFIIYFQLNRTLETLWRGGKDSKANPRMFRPHSGHIYNTDNLMQYADIIATMVIPQVVNMDSYAVVNKDYCHNLEDHFVGDKEDSNWVKLEGRNRVYFDYIKIRMVDDFEDPRLYCEILSEDREVKLAAEGTDEEILANVPAFMKTGHEVTAPNQLLNPAVSEDIIKGEESEEDDLPF